MNKLSPTVSEFETEEEAEAYDRWFEMRRIVAEKTDKACCAPLERAARRASAPE